RDISCKMVSCRKQYSAKEFSYASRFSDFVSWSLFGHSAGANPKPISTKLSHARRRRLHHQGLSVSQRRDFAGIEDLLSHDWFSGTRRQWCRVQRSANWSRHGRRGYAVSFASVWKRFVWDRAASGCDKIFHHPARRHRSREIKQTQRRTTRQISTLHVRRHGCRAVPIADQKTRSEPSAAGNGHVYGWNADLGLGRDLSGFHGCVDAFGE